MNKFSTYKGSTNKQERVCTICSNGNKLKKAVVQTVEDFLVGKVELGAGIVVYKVGGYGLAITEATGYQPDWLKYCEE